MRDALVNRAVALKVILPQQLLNRLTSPVQVISDERNPQRAAAFSLELSGRAEKDLVTLERVPGRNHHDIIGRILACWSRMKDARVSPLAGADAERDQISLEAGNEIKIFLAGRLDQHIQIRAQVQKEPRVLIPPPARLKH